MIKYELMHADTCLPDYWGGHHLPHVAVYAYPMTPRQLANALRDELNSEALMGGYDLPNTPRALDQHYAAMFEAVDDAYRQCQATMLFSDMPHMDEYDEHYDVPVAYFVFLPITE